MTTTLKLIWNNYDKENYLHIPYEINHNFLFEIEKLINNWTIKLSNINIAWPDFWRGWQILNKPNLLKFISDCDYLEKWLDEIIKIVPLPEEIWKFDDGYVEWFEMNNSWHDFYIPSWIKKVNKNDIIILLWLMKKIAKKALEKWTWLQFVWD